MRWRREGGYKKGRGKEEKGGKLGLAYDFGVGCDFGDLRNLWRFLGLLRGGKYFSSWSGSFILDTHTTSGWTWARRAREPVEVSWARNYFLVGWEVNPVGSIKRSVQQE